MNETNRCDEIREELSALLDGELAPERRDQVEAHTALCGRCAQELRQLEAANRWLTEGHALPEVGPELRSGLAAKIAADDAEADDAASHRVRHLPVWRRPAAVVFAAAAALVLAFVVGDPFGEPNSEQGDGSLVAEVPSPRTAPQVTPAEGERLVGLRYVDGGLDLSEPADEELGDLALLLAESEIVDALAASPAGELALELDVIANLEALEAFLRLEEGTG